MRSGCKESDSRGRIWPCAILIQEPVSSKKSILPRAQGIYSLHYKHVVSDIFQIIIQIICCHIILFSLNLSSSFHFKRIFIPQRQLSEMYMKAYKVQERVGKEDYLSLWHEFRFPRVHCLCKRQRGQVCAHGQLFSTF